jgi:hypothetical protein
MIRIGALVLDQSSSLSVTPSSSALAPLNVSGCLNASGANLHIEASQSGAYSVLVVLWILNLNQSSNPMLRVLDRL